LYIFLASRILKADLVVVVVVVPSFVEFGLVKGLISVVCVGFIFKDNLVGWRLFSWCICQKKTTTKYCALISGCKIKIPECDFAAFQSSRYK
jgi:hypothetical protein